MIGFVPQKIPPDRAWISCCIIDNLLSSTCSKTFVFSLEKNIDSSIGDFLWSWTKLTLKVSFRALHRYRRVHGLNFCANLNLLSKLCLHYCSSNVHYNEDRYQSLSINPQFIYMIFISSQSFLNLLSLITAGSRKRKDFATSKLQLVLLPWSSRYKQVGSGRNWEKPP